MCGLLQSRMFVMQPRPQNRESEVSFCPTLHSFVKIMPYEILKDLSLPAHKPTSWSNHFFFRQSKSNNWRHADICFSEPHIRDYSHKNLARTPSCRKASHPLKSRLWRPPWYEIPLKKLLKSINKHIVVSCTPAVTIDCVVHLHHFGVKLLPSSK